MVCILCYFYGKTFSFQLQAKIKELFQAERKSNITVRAAAWIKKKNLIFITILLSATDLYWWTENKTKVLISNYLKRYSIF